MTRPRPSCCPSFWCCYGTFLLCASVLPSEITEGVTVADVNLFSWDQPLVRICEKEFGPLCLSVTPVGSHHNNTLLYEGACGDLVKASLMFYYEERWNTFQ